MASDRAKTQFDRFEHFTDLPLAFLALLIVPAIILEERAESPYLREAALAINWIVWLAFCGEYLGKLVPATPFGGRSSRRPRWVTETSLP